MAHILVIDDEPSIRLTLERFLQTAGHETTVAEDAPGGLAAVKAREFDVILSDYILPGLTREDYFLGLRRAAPHSPVVLMTGEPGYESAAMAIRIKASGYLCKPVRKEDLFEAVGAALEEKAQNDKRRELEKENHRYRESLERLVEERSAQLRQNALRARAMIDASPEAILLIDLEGTILECNQGFVCQAGGTREQLIGSSAYQTTPDAEGDRRRALDEVVRTRQPVHMSGKRGSREIKGSLMPVLDDQGQVAQIAIFVRDALEA